MKAKSLTLLTGLLFAPLVALRAADGAKPAAKPNVLLSDGLLLGRNETKRLSAE